MTSVKKTLLTTMGKITINCSHSFSQKVNGFQMSSLVQDLVAYAGQLNVYGKSNDILERFLGIGISTMQVNKVTDYYGSSCAKEEALLQVSLKPMKPKEVLYVEADGSMLFTRDNGWKEVKVGRLFKSGDCIDPNGKQSCIRHSQYYGHLGDSKTFTSRMDTMIDNYQVRPQQLVFISDGAPWIRNWVEDSFPQAIAILDYYHALGHLCQFATKVFPDKAERDKWTNQQKELLLDSNVDGVIDNINMAKVSNMEAANELISYYESNKKRMDYKYYKTIGAGIIGSGAIESAHRTLIQNRMKLSGQRWSLKGAQNMINLKTVYLNEQWDNITLLTKQKLAA